VLPVIEITLYNLASSYVGARPSGWDMRQIQGWVHELASKNHKIRYDRKEGGKVIGTVDVYMPIIYAFIKRDEEDSITYLLKLNPIFRDQIANQFVLLPNDYQERLSAAFSGKPTKDGKPTRAKPTKAGIAFCDYLILQLSFKNGGFKETISIEKLGEIMGIQKSRFKKDRIRVNYIIGRAMEVAAKVGLLDGQIVPSYDKSGMAWITYTARKNWHTLPPRIENYKPPKFE
jgi:hypothetical protein